MVERGKRKIIEWFRSFTTNNVDSELEGSDSEGEWIPISGLSGCYVSYRHRNHIFLVHIDKNISLTKNNPYLPLSIRVQKM